MTKIKTPTAMKPGQTYMAQNGDYVILRELYKQGRRWVWDCSACLSAADGRRYAMTSAFFASDLSRRYASGELKLAA